MQITLNQDEIFSALDAYVRSQISVKDGMEISIDMKAGRGENGYSATIDIVPEGTAKAAAATAPISKGNPFAKPATAASTTPVETPAEETPVEEASALVEEATQEPEAPAEEGAEPATKPAGSIFSKAKSLS